MHQSLLVIIAKDEKNKIISPLLKDEMESLKTETELKLSLSLKEWFFFSMSLNFNQYSFLFNYIKER